jgi:hypothetical protein
MIMPSLLRRSLPMLGGAPGRAGWFAAGGLVADDTVSAVVGSADDSCTGEPNQTRTPRSAARKVPLTPRLVPEIVKSFGPLDQVIAKTGFYDVAERADFEVEDSLIEFRDHLAGPE